MIMEMQYSHVWFMFYKIIPMNLLFLGILFKRKFSIFIPIFKGWEYNILMEISLTNYNFPLSFTFIFN